MIMAMTKAKLQNMRRVKVMDIKMATILESDSTLCSGFRAPEDCPHESNFDYNSKFCKECCDNALKVFIIL